MKPGYKGVFPVVPTPFLESGALDIEGQKRCVDFMIDAGSDGLCILANYSEQFVLSDDERTLLTRTILEHAAGRVPVIVTTSHFSTAICLERCRSAQQQGAAMVMAMPPYHGATLRAGEAAIFEFFQRVSDGIDIPIMIQDAPMSGTFLSIPFLARMAHEIEHLSYFKIETQGVAGKLRELIKLGGEHVIGPWDGEEGITLLTDLEAGATGAMTGGGFPDGIRQVVDAHVRGDREGAYQAYSKWLPLIKLRESSVRTASCKGADEGRRDHRQRCAAASGPAVTSRNPRRSCRYRTSS